MAKYNGHRSYNAWNVSVNLSNDENMYRIARRLCVVHGIRKGADILFDRYLAGCETGDGVPFTRTNVRLAMRGILG